MPLARLTRRSVISILLLFVALCAPPAFPQSLSRARVSISVESGNQAAEPLLRVVSSSLEVYLNLEDMEIVEAGSDSVADAAGERAADLALEATVHRFDDEVSVDLLLRDGRSGVLLGEQSVRESMGRNLDRPIVELAGVLFSGVEVRARDRRTESTIAASRVDTSQSESEPSDSSGPTGAASDVELSRTQVADPSPRQGEGTPPVLPAQSVESEVRTQTGGIETRGRESGAVDSAPTAGADRRTVAESVTPSGPGAPRGSEQAGSARVAVSTVFSPILPVEAAARYIGASYGATACLTVLPFAGRAIGFGLSVRAIGTTIEGLVASADLLLFPIGVVIQFAGELGPVRPLGRVTAGATVLQARNSALGDVAKLLPYAAVDLGARAALGKVIDVEIGVGFEAHFEQSIFILGFSPSIGLVVSL